MRTESSFSPQWASAPGDTIKDMLDQRGLTISAFAQQLACTYDDALALLSGRMALTPFLAQQLSRAVGSSVDFWLTRESQFREDTARVQQMDAEWVRNIPIAEMIRFGWLAAEASLSLREATILSFFDMPSISAIRAEYRTLERAFAFKRSRSHETQPAPLAAWLRQGVVEAEKIKCTAWDPSGFRQALDKIRDLTRSKHPNQFIPVLQRSCATHGVAAVVVRTPNGCPASGATRFLSREKALIMLSFRYLTDDHFWFTFFHEAGHLLLHSENELFLENDATVNDPREEEANQFAANALVPPEQKKVMLALRVNAPDVVRFALRAGVAPGIIVGQLQHLRRIGYNQLNGLKRRYSWGN